MNKRLMIIIVVILVILLGIGIYFGVRSNNVNKYKTADVYTVKGEEIASVKAAIGEKKVKKYSHDKEDTETLELTFEDSDNKQSAAKYIDYLKNNGNYIEMRVDNNSKKQIAKSADNSDDLVTVEVELIDNGFKVIIVVGPGTIQLDSIE